MRTGRSFDNTATDSTPPSTYSRGTNRIDFLLVSTRLLTSVLRTGILPYNTPFLSDHRACYIDLDVISLFSDRIPSIIPAKYHGLELQDPRIVNKYYNHLWKQIRYHKLDIKIQELYASAVLQPTLNLGVQYETIDKLLTEAMLYAESKSTKQYSTQYQWSPALKQAVYQVKNWQMRIKEANGRLIHR